MFQKWTPSFSGAERQNLDVWIWSETRRSLELASSVLKRLFPGQGPGCKALRLQRKAAEADDAEIKCASSPPIHVTLRHAQADYSDKQALSSGAEAKWRVFCSLSLRSGFSSLHLSPLHMLMFRPRGADEAGFSNPQFAQLFSIILPSRLLSFPLARLCAEITCWLTAKAN